MRHIEKAQKSNYLLVRFAANYLWFWIASFGFMRGHSKLFIIKGCLNKSIPFCIIMERWRRIENKELAYAMMDRTIEI
jgi:hypothetical protein